MVLALRGGDVRAAKQAIADALRATLAYEHVPASQVHAVERATLPNLPSVEVIGLTSSPQEIGPLIRHELSIELTVSAATEDGADEQLDSLVTAVRRRLLAASRQDEVDPHGRRRDRLSDARGDALVHVCCIGCGGCDSRVRDRRDGRSRRIRGTHGPDPNS